LSAGTLKANEGDRYTTFAKELGDGVMMMWIAEEGSITDISVDDITGLLLVSQEAVKSFYELSADFAPEKYHVGIGIAIGSFQRLLYPDKGSPDRFLYRDYCGGTINMAARVESLSRPNGVSVYFHALPLNKKKEIDACITAQGFREATQEIRGIGRTQVYQWKFSVEEPGANDQAPAANGNSTGVGVVEPPRGQSIAKTEKVSN
jgi:class 3 adenylate cyclase